VPKREISTNGALPGHATATTTPQAQPPRNTSVASIAMTDFGDFDDYGCDNLDDMDFMNPDEVCFQSPVKQINKTQPLNRPIEQSKQLEQNNELSKTPVLNQPKPQPYPQPPRTTTTNHQIQRPPQPVQNGEGSRPNQGAHISKPQPIASTPIPSNLPVQWLNPRSLLGQKDGGESNPSNTPPIVPFDPHAPWHGKKTEGISHSKSGPIKFDQVKQPPVQPLVQPPIGNGAPQNRPNFVNPQADTNRKIGMPTGAMASPMGNRSAYKPPGPATAKRPAEAMTRPALTDVSNMPPSRPAESGPIKKPRIEEVTKPIQETTAPTTNTATTAAK
jgi:DNA repair and recombination protein RAD52